MTRVKWIVSLVLLVVLAGAVAYLGYKNYRGVSLPVETVTIADTSSNLKLKFGSNKALMDKYLQDWGMWDEEGRYYLAPDYKSRVMAKVKSIVIQPMDQELPHGFVDTTGTKKVISFAHLFENDTLYLQVHVDQDYYNQPEKIGEKDKIISAGIMNTLFAIAKPPQPGNRAEYDRAMVQNNKDIRAQEPIFIY